MYQLRQGFPLEGNSKRSLHVEALHVNLYQINPLLANLLDKRTAIHLNIALIENIASYTLWPAVIFAESG